MKTRVFKFGGASVRDADGIRNVASIIRDFGLSSFQVVVVSAMGKTTNALEELLLQARNGDDFGPGFQKLREAHLKVARDLFPVEEFRKNIESDLEGYFDNLFRNLQNASGGPRGFHYDQVVCFGEYLSSYLLYSWLKSSGFSVFLQDAAELIRTDETWREGEVLLKESARQVENVLIPQLGSGIVLTQGFIGGTENGHKTTLGREGSDYTAALLAYFLGSESVSIWKDVPGVLSADPRWMPEAVLLPELSYQDAAELTFYGATVIHPKTIRPLAWKRIPLYVRSFLQPSEAGTCVGPDAGKQVQEAYIRKPGQVLVSLSSRDFSFMEEENITEVLHAFSCSTLKMQMLQVSATSISIVTDWDEERLDQAFEQIKTKYSVLFNQNLTLITIQNPGEKAEGFLLNGKTAILVQRTRSTLQLLFSEN